MAIRKDDFNGEDLRSRFTALRTQEEAQAPKFSGLAASQAKRQLRSGFAGRFIAATACVAMILAAALWLQLFPHRERDSGQPVAALAQWKAPTDFLLQTPGREWLQSVPTLDLSQDFAGAFPRTHDRRRQKKKLLP